MGTRLINGVSPYDDHADAWDKRPAEGLPGHHRTGTGGAPISFVKGQGG